MASFTTNYQSMRYLLLLLPLVGVLLVQSCGDEGKATEPTVDPEQAIAFMASNCYTCHHPTAPEDNRIAPPMIAIKRHYLDYGMNRDEFIATLVDFVRNPSATTARMPGAVQKFGLMPRFSYPEEQVQNLAAYIFDHDIEQPDWFATHYNSRTTGGTNSTTLAEQGLQYANATKAALGKQLMQALQQGSEHAVEFCHTIAIPLTDSMSEVQQVSVRRVSDKPRNPANTADAKSTAHIAYFQALLNQGRTDLPPVTEQIGHEVTVYVPIITNTMCLACHGNPASDIDEPTLARIQSLYPADQATGYAENQVRGLFLVSWEETQEETQGD